jgi:hypothetical protein
MSNRFTLNSITLIGFAALARALTAARSTCPPGAPRWRRFAGRLVANPITRAPSRTASATRAVASARNNRDHSATRAPSRRERSTPLSPSQVVMNAKLLLCLAALPAAVDALPKMAATPHRRDTPSPSAARRRHERGTALARQSAMGHVCLEHGAGHRWPRRNACCARRLAV